MKRVNNSQQELPRNDTAALEYTVPQNAGETIFKASSINKFG